MTALVCRDKRANQQAREKKVGRGGRENQTKRLWRVSHESNALLRFSSLPLPLSDATQPSRQGREGYPGGEPRLLTVGGVPADGVQLGVAVVEEKLMLRPLGLPLQQGHQVPAVDDPGGWSRRGVRWPRPPGGLRHPGDRAAPQCTKARWGYNVAVLQGTLRTPTGHPRAS